MEHIRFRFLLWYLLLSRPHGHTLESTKSKVFDDMSGLKELCPYSSFCGINASTEFPYNENYRPCCQSCSCDEDCGLRGDCCFSHLDEYNSETDSTICRHAFAFEHTQDKGIFAEIARTPPHYRMIYKCGTSNSLPDMTEKTCTQNASDIEETFSPMFSPHTGHIYINAFCIKCNNITDAIPWQRALVCPDETSFSDFMDQPQDEQISASYSECSLYYIPPLHVSLESELCDPKIIRKCSATKLRTERNHFWDYCEMFNATFVLKNAGYQTFANVYCFLCNGASYTHAMNNMKCKSSNPFDDEKYMFSSVALTVILDSPGLSESRTTSRKEAEHDQCPMDSVMVKSFTKSCRRRRCPTGQFLRNDQCGYFSKQWIGSTFAVVLRLSRIKKDVLLPISFFRDMSSKDRYDTRASWIRRRTLQRWEFLVMYNPSENQETVEYIVVKATHPSAAYSTKSVDPYVLQISILRALHDKWEIVYDNITISFTVNLNEHFEYNRASKVDLLSLGMNVTNSVGYFPDRLVCEPVKYLDKDQYKLLLLPIQYFNAKELNTGLFITELFYCDQIELLPEEYDFLTCKNILFKVKNITLETFSTVRMPNHNEMVQNTLLTYLKRTSRVYVCLEEFEITGNGSAHASVYLSKLFFTGMLVMSTVLSRISRDVCIGNCAI